LGGGGEDLGGVAREVADDGVDLSEGNFHRSFWIKRINSCRVGIAHQLGFR
jgi:hypothetical protein